MAGLMKTEADSRWRLTAGTFLLPLRLVVGWTYFSAFWRRLILENKLDPDAAGYVGEKFNHFLPNALLIGPAIEWFVTHPDALQWKLIVFTLVEAVVGLMLMLGLMTRWAGLATAGLAGGILFGAGWLGTTCLDEWQIGTLGLAGGLALMYAGGGQYSLDRWLEPKLERRFRATRGYRWLTVFETPRFVKTLPWVAVSVLGITLATNQIFHGGVWGTLHNLSVRPKVEVTDARLAGDALLFGVYRTEGADVYGSFTILVRLLDERGLVVAEWDGRALSALSPSAIENAYVAKVKPGKHSLVLPLGARARVTLKHPALNGLSAKGHKVELTDVSGTTWSAPLN